MAYSWKEFLGSKTVVSEAFVQQRINDWRPGRYDISKAPDTEWKVDDPELMAKYHEDWNDIHGNMGVLPEKEEDMTICNKFYLVAAEKVAYVKRIYGGCYKQANAICISSSNKEAAKIRMNECLEWASMFSHVDKEDIRKSWDKEMLSGKWKGGYIPFKVESDNVSDSTSIGKEKDGGVACR